MHGRPLKYIILFSKAISKSFVPGYGMWTDWSQMSLCTSNMEVINVQIVNCLWGQGLEDGVIGPPPPTSVLFSKEHEATLLVKLKSQCMLFSEWKQIWLKNDLHFPIDSENSLGSSLVFRFNRSLNRQYTTFSKKITKTNRKSLKHDTSVILKTEV